MEIVVTDSERIRIYPVHLYNGQLRHPEKKVASRCG